MPTNGFTKTQQALLQLLSDGQPHPRKDLIACLGDSLADRFTLNRALKNLRPKLRTRPEDIICELKHKGIHYRHVKLLAPPPVKIY